MNYFGKYYKSNGAGRCRFWYHFDMLVIRKWHLDLGKKYIGYWNMYYDGYYHFFSLWPFVFRWHKMPITEHEYIEIHLK